MLGKKDGTIRISIITFNEIIQLSFDIIKFARFSIYGSNLKIMREKMCLFARGYTSTYTDYGLEKIFSAVRIVPEVMYPISMILMIHEIIDANTT